MTERDGYYAMSVICIAVGVTVLVMFVLPTTRRLQSESVQLSRWWRRGRPRYGLVPVD